MDNKSVLARVMELCPTFQVNQTVDDTTFPLNDTLDVKTTGDYNFETIMPNLEKGDGGIKNSHNTFIDVVESPNTPNLNAKTGQNITHLDNMPQENTSNTS